MTETTIKMSKRGALICLEHKIREKEEKYNREKEEFPAKAILALEGEIERVKAGGDIHRSNLPWEPCRSWLDDYRTFHAFLSASLDEYITLTQKEFRDYIQ